MAGPRTRAHNLMRRYNLTAEQYALMLDAQHGVCAVCGGEDTRNNNNSEEHPLVVDHDHATGKVRGLICHSCNIAIGLMQDNPAVLVAAALYIHTEGAESSTF